MRKTNSSTSGGLAPYWERLEPEQFEYAGGSFEVAAFDDRAGTGAVYVQFARVSGRGRRVATLAVREPAELGELVSDLAELRQSLEALEAVAA